MSTLTVSALCVASCNVVSVFSSSLFTEPFMTVVSPLKFGCMLRQHSQAFCPGMDDLNWQLLLKAGRLGWQNLHAWLITVILRHRAGPVALAMQKCFVVTAVRADIEEGSLYFLYSKAGFHFSCDRPAALARCFMSNSSWQAWESSGKQK